jgi:hypothetical protein
MPFSRSQPPAWRYRTIPGSCMSQLRSAPRALASSDLPAPVIAAVIETTAELACRPYHKPACRFGHHRCMHDVDVERVTLATRSALANSGAAEKLNAV